MNLEAIKDIPPWNWPENASSILLDSLADQKLDPSQRLLAARLAGAIALFNFEIAQSLLNILQNPDESEEMRKTAVHALGTALESYKAEDNSGIQEEKLQAKQIYEQINRVLQNIYADDTSTLALRQISLQTSVLAPAEWHKKAIMQAFEEREKEWRLTALSCMRFIPGFDQQIIQALHEQDQDIKLQALQSAASCKLEQAWDVVVAMLTDETTDKPLRIASIEAAAAIRPQEASRLIEGLTDALDADIVEAALDALFTSKGLTDLDEDSLDFGSALDEE